MKSLLIFLMLLVPFFLTAQVKKKKHRHALACKPSITDFFEERKLCIDSVAEPHLFYLVYEWAGTHYKYSGKTKKGIDCSGFVNKMYEGAYCCSLNGGSKDIWKAVSPLEKCELKEGDIVFFKIRKGQISHVGIYLGNNKFAHASVQSGVIVSDLDEAYYKKYFYKGGRLLHE